MPKEIALAFINMNLMGRKQGTQKRPFPVFELQKTPDLLGLKW